MIGLSLTDFRTQFTQFSDEIVYSDDLITVWYNSATAMMSDDTNPYMREATQQLCLYLLTAHLLVINNGMQTGKPVQAIQNAAEGSVNVGFVPPPVKNGWQWWLSSTPYGQQLWSILQTMSVGGIYLTGSYNTAGIRKPHGGFFFG